MTSMNTELGTALRNIRITRNITLQAAAEKARITVQSLQNIENGKSIPKLTTFAALCKFYDVPLDSFEHLIPKK